MHLPHSGQSLNQGSSLFRKPSSTKAPPNVLAFRCLINSNLFNQFCMGLECLPLDSYITKFDLHPHGQVAGSGLLAVFPGMMYEPAVCGCKMRVLLERCPYSGVWMLSDAPAARRTAEDHDFFRASGRKGKDNRA